MVVSLILNELFGESIFHILSFGHGQEGVGRLVDFSEYFSRISTMFQIINGAVFANLNIWYVIIVAVIALTLLVIFKRKEGTGVLALLKKEKAVLLIILGLSCFLFAVMIALTIPWLFFRYIACITPLVSFLYIMLLVLCLRCIIKYTAPIFLLISIPFSILLVLNTGMPYHLYRHSYVDREVFNDFHNIPVIFIAQHDRTSVAHYTLFFDFKDEILFTTYESIDFEKIGEKQYNDGLLLMILFEEAAPDDFSIDDIINAANLNDITHVLPVRHGDTYYLS